MAGMVDERHHISTLARNLVTKLRVLTYHLDMLTSGILLNGESTATRDSAPVFSMPNLPYECDDHYLISECERSLHLVLNCALVVWSGLLVCVLKTPFPINFTTCY